MNAIRQQFQGYSAALAHDVATGLMPLSEIAYHHGMSLQDLERLCRTPAFAQMVDQYRAEWGSLENAKDRIKAKSRLALEEGIVTLFEILNNDKAATAARVAAAKELKDMADLGLKSDQTAVGLPSISIVLGDHHKMEISGTREPDQQKAISDDDIIDIDSFKEL